MVGFDSHIYSLIREFTKGKKNLKFTVGYLLDDNMFIHVFGENGEFANQPPVFMKSALLQRLLHVHYLQNIFPMEKCR